MAHARFGEFKEGEDWTDYVDRFDQHCIAHDIKDTEQVKKKKALFLSVMGSSTYRLIRTLIAPTKPSAKSYKDLCELVEGHVAPKPIVIAERYNFYKRTQKEDENVSDYLAELRRLSETCDFGTFLEQAIRDMLVIGLKDRNAQKKLLSEKELDVKKAFEISLSYEMASKHIDAFHQDSDRADRSVKKVHRTREECFRCGRNNHSPDDCFYRNTQCYECQETGHVKQKCPQKAAKPKGKGDKYNKKGKFKYGKKKSSKVKTVNKPDDSEESDTDNDSASSDSDDSLTLMYIRNASNSKSEILVPVTLNDKAIKMELDTGAAVSLIPKRMKDKLLPHVKTRPSDIKLKTVTGETVQVVGKCHVQVKYNSQKPKDLPLYIINTKGPALLGRDWLSEIVLDWKKICAVRKVTEDDELKKLLQRYCTLFDGNLGKVQGVQVKLQLKEDATPQFFKPRPVPFAIREGVEKELYRLEKQGIIEKIQFSDWAAPIVPVQKPDGDIRICGDYKVTINQALKIPEHPMPKADELFQLLNGGQKFTKLDLSQAYQQVELAPESRQYLAINTHLGLYAYKRMPYGISSAPAIFQSTMDKLLNGLNAGCYLDDIIITGRNDKEHLNNLEQVLQRLHKANIQLRRDKCVFMQPTVTYLGFTIDSTGIRMDEKGTDAVRHAPRPRNRSELQSFLGLVNHYRKHIPNMSTLCNPLNNLLRKDQQWCWTTETENAFQRLKELLVCDKNVLIHYDPQKDVTLAVDASPVGLGAVLSQRTDKGEQPVAYASRSLTKCERNYAQLEKEGLAIIFGLKRFHQYLAGRKFMLVTDNKPLSLILGPKKNIPVLAAARMQRWAMELATYNYDLKHQPAERNCHADALSRLPLPETNQPVGIINWTAEASEVNKQHLSHLPITAKAIKAESQKDPTLSKVLHLTMNGWPAAEEIASELKPFYNRRQELSIEEGCLLWGTRTIIPNKFQKNLLHDLHACHPGMVRMKALARLHVWWPSIDADIEEQVRQCPVCIGMQPQATAATGNPWKWPSRPWHRIHVDFAGPFMGENFLLVVDAHSKWPIVWRMRSTTTERTIEKLRCAFADYGLPMELVSDNGPQFTSALFREFCKNNNVHHILSAPYHPSSNGEAERLVQTFKRAMKAKRSQKASWNQKITEFLLCYRNTPHTTTRRTPAELMFGRNLRTRLDAVHPNIGYRIQKQASSDKPTRSLDIGETVLVRDYRKNQSTWVRGVLVKKLGPCTYSVLVGSLIWKRHIDQIRQAVNDIPLDDQQSPDILLGDLVPSAPVCLPTPSSDVTTVVPTISHSPVPPVVPSAPKPVPPSGSCVPNRTPGKSPGEASQRRSNRDRNAPTYLKDYVT